MRTTAMLAACLVVTWGLTGCSSSDVGDIGDMSGLELDSDTPDDTAGEVDSEFRWVPEGEPILDREMVKAAECGVTRDTTGHSPLMWEREAHSLIRTSGGQVFFVRAESEPDDPYSVVPAFLVVSTMDTAGNLGNPVDTLALPPSYGSVSLDAAPVGEGFIVVWTDSEGFHCTVRDAQAEELVAPISIEGYERDYTTRPKLAVRGDEPGLVFSVPEGARRKVVFMRLGEQCQVVGAPVEWRTESDPNSDLALTVAAGKGGWGIAWQERPQERGTIYFSAVDPNGEESVDKTELYSSQPELRLHSWSFSRPRLSLMAVDEAWLIAWTEGYPGDDIFIEDPNDSAGAFAIIQLARLDGEGSVLEQAPLTAPIIDEDHVEPLLLPYMGKAALLWSVGSHIYVCGGCVPDHKMNFLLVDPLTFAPASETLSFIPNSGGLLDSDALAADEDLLVTFLSTFHVHAVPASGAISCQAVE